MIQRFAQRVDVARTLHQDRRRLPQRFDDDDRIEQLRLDRFQDGPVRFVEHHMLIVRAYRMPLPVKASARVEESPSTSMAATGDVYAAAADRALCHPGQQVLGFDAVGRLAPQLPVRAPQVSSPRRAQALPGGGPDVIGDDAELGRRDAQPVRIRSGVLLLLAPGIALPRPIPDDFSAVERPVQHFADGRRTPARRAPLLRTRTGRLQIVQSMGDRPESFALGAPCVDFAHDRGLVFPNDAHLPASISRHVVIAERAAAGDVFRAGLPDHRVIGSLPRLLALQFISERGEREHDLVGRTVKGALSIFEVEEHADAGCHNLLQRVRCFYRFAPESGFLRHDQRLKLREWFQAVHQSQKSRSVELRPADGIVTEDEPIIDGPALARRICFRMLDLARHRLLLVGDTVLCC